MSSEADMLPARLPEEFAALIEDGAARKQGWRHEACFSIGLIDGSRGVSIAMHAPPPISATRHVRFEVWIDGEPLPACSTNDPSEAVARYRREIARMGLAGGVHRRQRSMSSGVFAALRAVSDVDRVELARLERPSGPFYVGFVAIGQEIPGFGQSSSEGLFQILLGRLEFLSVQNWVRAVGNDAAQILASVCAPEEFVRAVDVEAIHQFGVHRDESSERA